MEKIYLSYEDWIHMVDKQIDPIFKKYNPETIVGVWGETVGLAEFLYKRYNMDQVLTITDLGSTIITPVISDVKDVCMLLLHMNNGRDAADQIFNTYQRISPGMGTGKNIRYHIIMLFGIVSELEPLYTLFYHHKGCSFSILNPLKEDEEYEITTFLSGRLIKI